MIAIIGHMDVDPTDRDGLIESTVDLQRSVRDDEVGCLSYTLSADPVLPGRIQIVELWDSAASLDAHFDHPNIRAISAALKAKPRLGSEAIKYRIDAVAPVRNADGVTTATFPDDAVLR